MHCAESQLVMEAAFEALNNHAGYVETKNQKKTYDVVNGIESHTGCCPNLVRHCVGHLFSPLHLHMLKLGRMPFRLNCVGVQVASQTDHWRIYEYSCKGCMMQLGAIVFPLIEWFLCHVPPNLYS